jgi:hypothetical protein
VRTYTTYAARDKHKDTHRISEIGESEAVDRGTRRLR